jgi:Spy/CpxP family protein refolding chaperone
MNRSGGRVWLVISVVIFSVTMSQVAEAQRGEGRRGRGGRAFGASAARLATAEEVQTALNLSDEQKCKVEEINDELRDKARDVFQSGGGFGELQKLNQEASGKLAEVLDDEQDKRLMGILIQVNGPNAVYEPSVAKALNVTGEQQTELATIREENMQAMGEAFREMRDLSREERRAKFDELRAESDKRVSGVLTPEQQTQLESLKGEPVEIDMSQFRGFGGRGDRDGRGDRERRDRDDDNSAGDSGT